MKIVLIAAMGRNRVIGADNRLPWHIPEDLKRFKRLTLGHPILMGRKTFQSIGKPLPGRRNIVISRDPSFSPEGVDVFRSLDAALAALQSELPEGEELYVVGGGEIYRQSIGRADRVHLTVVETEVDGDAYFPELPAGRFVETSREDHQDPRGEGHPAYRFVLYEKA